MKNDWKPKEIKVKELERKMKANEIAVPTYQRGVVWTRKMQKDLIDSIKNGYPFGSLIMFNYNEVGKPMLLIDGLQRSTALFSFVNEPSAFFDSLDIKDSLIDELCVVLGNSDASESVKKDIKNKLVEYIKKLHGSDEILKLDSYICASYLAHNFLFSEFVNPNDFDYVTNIKNILEPMFDDYKKIYNSIIDRDIPYIEITGSDEGLSDIFFRINDKGVKLSKENKFAATWTNKSINITNPKLNDFIRIVANRYDSIQSDGANIYGYDHQKFIDDKKLDVFELCHAFGKYIKREYPDLFGKITDNLKSEPIGFTLLNACLMGTKDSLPVMNKLLFDTFGEDSEKINTFIVKVLSSVKYVDSLLAPVIKFKSNKRIGGKPLHTDLQICSIVASVFRMKHITEIENGKYIFNLSDVNSDWVNYDLKLKDNLIKKYLTDTLNNVWAGHGDNTLDNIIHDSNYDYYTRDISRSDMQSTLYNWYRMYKNNNLELTEKDVKSPSNSDKLILNIIYTNTFSASMQLNEDKFDIEHIFPKKMAEKVLHRFSGQLKLSISSIGNLCLLPEYTNRKKKDKTLYEDLDYTSTLSKDITVADLEKHFTFTTKEQLNWINDLNLSLLDVESKYNNFIDSRFEIIVEKVLSFLYK